MLPDISEFSFGYAFTSELLNHYGIMIVGAPSFPTQNAEGEEGGYDVALRRRRGVPILLQFKRSDYMVNRRPPESKAVGVPHYRFHLRPSRHSAQHALLMAEEMAGNEVYYAAPRFHTQTELADAYERYEVAERSVLIEPSKIGSLPDAEDHHVAVSVDNKKWRFCSGSPREVAPSTLLEILEKWRGSVEKAIEITPEALRRVGDGIVRRFVAAGGAQHRLALVRERSHPADYARDAARLLLDCELMLAPVRS